MQIEDARDALADVELVPCVQAPLPEAKALRDACLEADIPVVLDRGACCGSGGCGCAPKLALYARAEDVPRIARLMQDAWRALALREGTASADHPAVAAPRAVGDGDHPPCPACGTAAPLAAGACSDCGLQLEWRASAPPSK